MELVQIPTTSQLPAGHDGPELTTAATSDDVEMPVELPKPVFDFLFSDRYRKSQEELLTFEKLTDDQRVLLGDMSRLVMAGAVPLDEALDTVADEYHGSVPDADRDQIFSLLLADRFLPLGDAITPTALEVARKRNLKLPERPYYRVYLKPLTFGSAATEIAAACGFSLMGGQMRERMRGMVLNKVKGATVDAQVKEMLMRPQEFDGLGLDAKTADRAVATMNEILSRATVLSEDEYANWLSRQQGAAKPVGAEPVAVRPAKTPMVMRTPVGATVAPTADDRDDEREIAAIKSNMPERPASALDKAVDETIGRLSYKAPDDYLAKRIRNIISSRLRDIRTADDVRQLLARDTKVGGLGLVSADAQRVAADIESGYAEFHSAVAEEEKGKLESQLEDQKQKVAERRRLEAAQHAKWYEEKIRSRKEQESVSAEAFGAMKSASAGQTPLDAKERRVETTKYGPLIPVAKPVVPTASMAKPGVKISPQTVEIEQKKVGERPTLDAMAYAGPKLMGLMGELRTMNVAQFRRFSKDPREAAKKIRSLLETLGQESFERRMEGITTFRASPLQGAYLALVAESFRTSRPVAQVAEEKRKQGENVLSADEIAAIMELNSALQY